MHYNIGKGNQKQNHQTSFKAKDFRLVEEILHCPTS